MAVSNVALVRVVGGALSVNTRVSVGDVAGLVVARRVENGVPVCEIAVDVDQDARPFGVVGQLVPLMVGNKVVSKVVVENVVEDGVVVTRVVESNDVNNVVVQNHVALASVGNGHRSEVVLPSGVQGAGR